MGFRDLITQLVASKPRAKTAPAAKSSLAGPMIAWSQTGQPRWTQRRYDQLAEHGFRKNVIAYRCVMQTAGAASAIPWLLYAGDGEELDRHPLLDLLRHPNPLQDGTAFLESVYSYLQIAGNAYIEAVKTDDDTAPVELYALRPDRMKVVPGPAGLPEAYQYTVNGQVTTWPADPLTGESNILHIRNFHPLDDWYGMAPCEAAQISIDQHNAAGSWNQALLNHGARPSGALVYAPKDGAGTLTDEQIHRLREELGMIYQGSRNAGRPLILEGGLDWREMSLSPKDMDWLAGRNVAARDIALAFGVPAQLVGIPDAQTYANMAEARMALYEETVLPLVNRVMGAFEHWLAPMYDEDLELDYDPDEVSALSARRDTQWNKLQSTDFLTINEKRHAIGYAPIDGGDVLDTANKKPNGSGSPAVSTPVSVPAAPATLITPFNSPFSTAANGNPKFNPYHDELGRFTFAPGGPASDDDDNDDDQTGDSGGAADSDDGESDTTSHGGNHFFPGVDVPKPQNVETVGDSPSAPVSWGNPQTLQEHYEDHGSDFGATSPEDYASQANQFYQRAQSENLPTVQGSDGTLRIYDPATNTFGVYNSDGTTATFYKPLDGLQYFQEQIDTDMSNGGRIINPLPEGSSGGGSGGPLPGRQPWEQIEE